MTNHLLKGYTFNSRLNRIEDNLEKNVGLLSKRIDDIELLIKTKELPVQGIFFDGQIYDAYVFVADIIKKAKTNIIFIDNYVDDAVLTLLAKRSQGVRAKIFTKSVNKQLQLDLDKHNQQYPPIEIMTFSDSHDRFLIIDNKELYHLGTSLKDLGKKWFAFSKMDSFTDDLLKKKA